MLLTGSSIIHRQEIGSIVSKFKRVETLDGDRSLLDITLKQEMLLRKKNWEREGESPTPQSPF